MRRSWSFTALLDSLPHSLTHSLTHLSSVSLRSLAYIMDPMPLFNVTKMSRSHVSFFGERAAQYLLELTCRFVYRERKSCGDPPEFRGHFHNKKKSKFRCAPMKCEHTYVAVAEKRDKFTYCSCSPIGEKIRMQPFGICHRLNKTIR